MAEKNLKIAIREEFEQEKTSLLNQAREEKETILTQAQKEIGLMRKNYSQELKKQVEQERIKLLNQLILEARKEILLEKERIFKKVLDKIRRELENLRRDREKYRTILKLLISEAKENFSNEIRLKVKVDKEGEELCKRAIAELRLNAEAEAMSQSTGGVIISDKEERCICNNSFTSRLDKIMPEIRQRLFELLGVE